MVNMYIKTPLAFNERQTHISGCVRLRKMMWQARFGAFVLQVKLTFWGCE